MIYIGQNAAVIVGNASINLSKVSFSEFTEANEKPAVSVTVASEVECAFEIFAEDFDKIRRMLREAIGGVDVSCPKCRIGRLYKNTHAAEAALSRLLGHVCPRGSR